MTVSLNLTRRRTLGLMGGLAGALALNACQSSSKTSGGGATDPITVAIVAWIGYSPLYVAEAKGFFENRGITVESKTFGSNGDMLSTFAAKKVTAQAATNPEVVTHAARGVDYRIVQMADASLGGDGILARNSVKDLADFKGRKVGVEIGTNSYYFLLQVLKAKTDLTIDDLDVVNIASDAAAAAYQSGNVDVAVTYAPFLQKANEAQPDGRVIIDTSALPTAILDIYLFHADFVEQNPEQVQAFVDGIFEARSFIKSNPEAAYAIIGEKLDLTPEDVQEQLSGVDLTSLATNKTVLTAQEGSESLVQNLVTMSQFLAEQEQIDAPLTAEQIAPLIDPSFVEASTIAD